MENETSMPSEPNPAHNAEPSSATRSSSPANQETPMEWIAYKAGSAIDGIYEQYGAMMVGKPHAHGSTFFSFSLGVVLTLLLYVLWQIVKPALFGKQRLKVRLEDGTRAVINAKAIRDLQEIASRDLGTPRRPRIQIRQTSKGLVVHAHMEIYEGQKNQEVKAHLLENLNREFHEKHNISVVKMDVEIDRVRTGKPRNSKDIFEARPTLSRPVPPAVATGPVTAFVIESPPVAERPAVKTPEAVNVPVPAQTVEAAVPVFSVTAEVPEKKLETVPAPLESPVAPVTVIQEATSSEPAPPAVPATPEAAPEEPQKTEEAQPAEAAPVSVEASPLTEETPPLASSAPAAEEAPKEALSVNQAENEVKNPSQS